jgi:hypothetical protein
MMIEKAALTAIFVQKWMDRKITDFPVGHAPLTGPLRFGSFGETTSGPKSFSETYEVGTGAKGPRWFARDHKWIAGTNTCSEALFAGQACRQERRDEKASQFGLWRACRDNDPVLQRIRGDGHARRDRRLSCCHLRTVQNNRTKSEKNSEGLRR